MCAEDASGRARVLIASVVAKGYPEVLRGVDDDKLTTGAFPLRGTCVVVHARKAFDWSTNEPQQARITLQTHARTGWYPVVDSPQAVAKCTARLSLVALH